MPNLKLSKKLMRNWKVILIVLIFQLIYFYFPSEPEKSSEIKAESSKNSNPNPYKVSAVIDGDTIKLESGQTIRYIGINTPETKHPTKKIECFGKEASEKNKELVEGKIVTLEKDVSETDRYGRLLRYVYVDNVLINKELVEQGFVYASSYPPDVKYDDVFAEAQIEARKNNRGLWDMCEN